MKAIDLFNRFHLYITQLKEVKKMGLKYDNVRIYSDGACKGNPGKGGYGTIVKILNDDNKVISTEEFAEGFDVTTNNRMEMLGIIAGLKSLEHPSKVTVVTDSNYIVKAFNQGWIRKWRYNGWKTSTGNDVKNKELWEIFLMLDKMHILNFKWIKGHNGHRENERCDYLASTFGSGKKLFKSTLGRYEEEEDIMNEIYEFPVIIVEDGTGSFDGWVYDINCHHVDGLSSEAEVIDSLKEMLEDYLHDLYEAHEPFPYTSIADEIEFRDDDEEMISLYEEMYGKLSDNEEKLFRLNKSVKVIEINWTQYKATHNLV